MYISYQVAAQCTMEIDEDELAEDDWYIMTHQEQIAWVEGHADLRRDIDNWDIVAID